MPSETEKELKRRYVTGEISEGEYLSAMERLREVEPEPLRPAYAHEAGILDNYLKNMGNIDLYAVGKISHEEQTILSWKNGLHGENDSKMRSQVISLIRNMQNEINTSQSLRFYDRSMPNHIRYQKLTEEDIRRMENYGIMDDPETGKRSIQYAKTPDSEASMQVGMPSHTKPSLSARAFPTPKVQPRSHSLKDELKEVKTEAEMEARDNLLKYALDKVERHDKILGKDLNSFTNRLFRNIPFVAIQGEDGEVKAFTLTEYIFSLVRRISDLEDEIAKLKKK